jgi:hypothetical protein
MVSDELVVACTLKSTEYTPFVSFPPPPTLPFMLFTFVNFDLSFEFEAILLTPFLAVFEASS